VNADAELDPRIFRYGDVSCRHAALDLDRALRRVDGRRKLQKASRRDRLDDAGRDAR